MTEKRDFATEWLNKETICDPFFRKRLLSSGINVADLDRLCDLALAGLRSETGQKDAEKWRFFVAHATHYWEGKQLWETMGDIVLSGPEAVINEAMSFHKNAAPQSSSNLPAQCREGRADISAETGVKDRSPNASGTAESASTDATKSHLITRDEPTARCVAVPRQDIEHLREYWNGNHNERAMSNALEVILGEFDRWLGER